MTKRAVTACTEKDIAHASFGSFIQITSQTFAQHSLCLLVGRTEAKAMLPSSRLLHFPILK